MIVFCIRTFSSLYILLLSFEIFYEKQYRKLIMGEWVNDSSVVINFTQCGKRQTKCLVNATSPALLHSSICACAGNSLGVEFHWLGLLKELLDGGSYTVAFSTFRFFSVWFNGFYFYFMISRNNPNIFFCRHIFLKYKYILNYCTILF